MTLTETRPPETPPRPVEDPARNVVEALTRVMRDMPAIGKDKEMGSGNSGYRYRSVEAITSSAATLFGRHGILVVPRVTERAVQEIKMGSGSSIWTEDHLTVLYTLYGPGGVEDRIEAGPFHALARDNSDKGTLKAMTQAFKMMLLQVLCIGDNKDDPDSYAAEDRHESTPPAAPDPDEEARIDGWEGAADFKETKAAVLARIKAEIPEARGVELWADYQRPDGLDVKGRGRTRAEHDTWIAEHLDTPTGEVAAPPAETPTPAAEPPGEVEATDTPPEVPDPLRTVYRDHGMEALIAELAKMDRPELEANCGYRRLAFKPVEKDDILRVRIGNSIAAQKS